MKIKFILSGIALAATFFVSAQNLNTEKLDQYFETLDQHSKFMGTVAISSNDQIIYKKAVGYSDIENNRKSDTETQFKIGSVSKTFTAVLIFKAIEENKLKLDTKLSKFYPQIKNSEKITIKNLLNHSSGIYSITDDETYLSWNTQEISETDLINKIIEGGIDFEPNTKSEYSNSNYILLSFILEKAFKKSYSQLLEKYITKPLNLKNTYFGKSKNSDQNIANSYLFNEVWQLETDTHPSIPMGAGAILSTPSDLVVFINALFEGKILKKENLAQMKTFENNFGLGLFQFPFENHSGIGHDGAIDGFKSVLSIFEKEKISYAIISNGSNYNMNLITNTMLDALFNDNYNIPEFKEIDFSAEELDKFAGIYTNPDLPFKIEIKAENMKLTAQATGQSAFPLEAVDKNIFTFDKAGIKLIFQPENKIMILNQAGQEFELKKE